MAQKVGGALDEVIKGRPWTLPPENGVGSNNGNAGDGTSSSALPVDGPRQPGPALTAEDDDRLPPAKPLNPTKQHLAERRAARAARWRRAHESRAQGASLRGIANALGIKKATVQHLLRCAAPPHNVVVRPRPGGIDSPKLAPYTADLQRRWRAGCTNGSQLFRDVVRQGYTGSCTLLPDAIPS